MTRWRYATQEWGRTTSWAAVSGKEGLERADQLPALLAVRRQDRVDVGALFLVFKQPDEGVAVPNVG